MNIRMLKVTLSDAELDRWNALRDRANVPPLTREQAEEVISCANMNDRQLLADRIGDEVNP